jgi:hypothetical protein
MEMAGDKKNKGERITNPALQVQIIARFTD